MVFAAVMAADLFNGLNTHVWTGWIFFAVSIGIVLIWVFTVSAISKDSDVKLIVLSGCLFGRCAQLCHDDGLRKRLLPLPFGELLVLPSACHHPCSSSSVHCEGIQVLVQPE